MKRYLVVSFLGVILASIAWSGVVPASPRPPKPKQLSPGQVLVPPAHRVKTGFKGIRVARRGYGKPNFRYFDRLMLGLIQRHRVPGASLALAKDGKLVYAKGFGYADMRTKKRVTPTSMFRIASVSKPIAAVVIMRLVERGKLRLNDRVYRWFKHIKPPRGRKVNPQIYKITVQDLLRHTSGQQSYNRRGRISSPMQPPISRRISALYKAPHPPKSHHVIGYMKSLPLASPVGTKFKYSNYGYMLLGQLVKRVTGKSFEAYAKQTILRPRGLHCMHMGRTLYKHRKAGEVTYYDLPGRRFVRHVLDGHKPGPFPYAGRHLEGWGAAGAWIASAVDIVRFVDHVDGRRSPALLRRSSIRAMIRRQSLPQHRRAAFWYGLGWRIQRKRRGAHWYHNGASNGGAAALMVRSAYGYTWSAHFNRRLPAGRALYKQFTRGMWRGIRRHRRWRPTYDLSSRYRCRKR